MSVVSAHAQNNDADLLLQKLQSTNQDLDKVDIYYALSKLYANKNPDSALLMADNSLAIARRINSKKGIALAYIVKGEALLALERFEEALKCDVNCLQISEQLKLAVITEKAYNDIGLLYSAMGNISRALYYLRLSYNHAKSTGGSGLKSYIYMNLGDVYRKNKQYDSAIFYNTCALKMERVTHDSLVIAISLFNIGENYIKKEMYVKALPYLKESLEISTKINDYVGFPYCNEAYSQIYYNQGNYALSIEFAKKGLDQAKSLKISEIKKSCYNLLYLNYTRLENYKEALVCRDQEIILSDSINSLKKDKEIKNIVMDYQLEKQNSRIALLEKDKEFKDVELKTESLKRNILGIASVLLALIGCFVFRSYLQKRKLSLQLEKQNKEILDQNQQLEELNNVKTKLFSIVSHDLRGPIGSVKSIMDLMQADMISADETKTIIPQLSDSLLQTSHLLDNLLYWAKSQMNGMILKQTNFDINLVVQQNIQLIQSRATGKKVKLYLETDTDTLFVQADEPTTDIVTRNLIENAIKFSSPGDQIIVHTEINNDEVIISVKDEGKGIPYADQSKIFNKLGTHTTFGTSREKGSGLGLLLCKELVENNKGKIWFTSEPGKGSTFTYSLPYKNNVNDFESNITPQIASGCAT